MSDSELLHRLEGIDARFQEVSTLITDPDVIADMKRYVKLSKEYKDLERLVATTNRYRKMLKDIDDAKEVLETESDEELRELAKEDIEANTSKLAETEEEIKLLLIPEDPEDDRNAVVEIRGGTGGDEAAIFAGDLFRMYTKYCEMKGWHTEVSSFSEGASGGRVMNNTWRSLDWPQTLLQKATRQTTGKSKKSLRLFMMIRFAAQDGHGAVALFHKKEAHHLVGKRHARQREFFAGSGVDVGRETIRAAHHKNQTAGRSRLQSIEMGRKLHRAPLFSTFVEQDDVVGRSEGFQDEFAFTHLLHVGRHGLGIFEFRNDLYVKRHIVAQSCDIAIDELLNEGIVGFAHHKQTYFHRRVLLRIKEALQKTITK